MEYSNPKEFANHIKRERFQFEIEPDDLEERIKALKAHYGSKIADSRYEKILTYDETNTKFQPVIDAIVEEFKAVWPKNIRDLFEKHFYFSTIDNRSINASVFKSPNGSSFVAVLINSSLINLLTKLGKLDVALEHPDSIVFCNRFPNSKPTREEVKVMRNEMYNYFQEFKMSHGPFIILDEMASIYHFNKLDIQEKLIVFHEIGHFINGDLFQSRDDQEVNPNIQNIHHQREIMADLIGFGLLLKVEKKSGNISLERRMSILLAVISLFDVMYGLQKEETDKYPLPLNRMNAIVEYYYGIEIADIVEKTYTDRGAFEFLLPENCPTIKSQEDTMDAAIEKALESLSIPKNWK